MKLRQLFEAPGDTVGLIFGRFNPPHKGHKAAWQMCSKNTHWYVGTNRETMGPTAKKVGAKGAINKDPLPFPVKIKAMSLVWPEVTKHIIADESWFTLASKLYQKHGEAQLNLYTDEAWVMQTFEKVNGVEGRHGYFNFKTINAVATPRLASATDLRKAVADNDPQRFAELAGTDINAEIDGVSFFEVVQTYLGMSYDDYTALMKQMGIARKS
tara:strand:- start:2428 stop:3066 length:639 start_codon:yes stop_codon:yes gene_type:complete